MRKIAYIMLLLPLTTSAQSSSCLSLTHNMGYRATDTTTGGEVSQLQVFLITQGYLSDAPTGFYGTLTKAAVTRFQSAHAITPASGYTGQLTRTAIHTVSCGTSSSSSSSSSQTNCQAGARFNTQTGQPCTTSSQQSTTANSSSNNLASGQIVIPFGSSYAGTYDSYDAYVAAIRARMGMGSGSGIGATNIGTAVGAETGTTGYTPGTDQVTVKQYAMPEYNGITWASSGDIGGNSNYLMSQKPKSIGSTCSQDYVYYTSLHGDAFPHGYTPESAQEMALSTQEKQDAATCFSRSSVCVQAFKMIQKCVSTNTLACNLMEHVEAGTGNVDHSYDVGDIDNPNIPTNMNGGYNSSYRSGIGSGYYRDWPTGNLENSVVSFRFKMPQYPTSNILIYSASGTGCKLTSISKNPGNFTDPLFMTEGCMGGISLDIASKTNKNFAGAGGTGAQVNVYLVPGRTYYWNVRLIGGSGNVANSFTIGNNQNNQEYNHSDDPNGIVVDHEMVPVRDERGAVIESSNGYTRGYKPNSTSCTSPSDVTPPANAYTLNPTSGSASAGGQTGTVTVMPPTGSIWSSTQPPSSNATWLTISNVSYTNKTFMWTAAANTTAAQRTGIVTVAGTIFTVTQGGVGNYLSCPIFFSDGSTNNCMTGGNAAEIKTSCCPNGTITSCTATPGGVVIMGTNCAYATVPKKLTDPTDMGDDWLTYAEVVVGLLRGPEAKREVGSNCTTDWIYYGSWDKNADGSAIFQSDPSKVPSACIARGGTCVHAYHKMLQKCQ